MKYLFLFLILAISVKALAQNRDWHAYSDVSPEVLRRDVLRLMESSQSADRALAADLLARFPLYFSLESYLVVTKQLLPDEDAEVKRRMVSALFEVATGGFPAESRKKQRFFLSEILSLLETVRLKAGYESEEIDELSRQIRCHPVFFEKRGKDHSTHPGVSPEHQRG